MSSLPKRLQARANEIDAVFIARYIGGVGHPDRAPDEISKLQFLGISVPTLRDIYKQSELPPDAPSTLRLAQTTQIYEVRSCCLMHLRQLERKGAQPSPHKLIHLEKWIVLVDNWACSDQLSDMVARSVEQEGARAWEILKKWNQSSNPWARRQSIVGLYYYQRQRKKLPPAQWAPRLLKPLLQDPHFYVQRGVGWCLREWYQAAPTAQVAFVKKHLAQISATAWFAAAEKYPKKLQQELTQKRAELRAERRSRKSS